MATAKHKPELNAIDLVNPAALVAAYLALPRVRRWRIAMILAGAVLAIAVILILQTGIKQHQIASAPVGYEALASPYNIEARGLPLAAPVLPDQIGDFSRVIPPSPDEVAAVLAAEVQNLREMVEVAEATLVAYDIPNDAGGGVITLTADMLKNAQATLGALGSVLETSAAPAAARHQMASSFNALRTLKNAGVNLAEIDRLTATLEAYVNDGGPPVIQLNVCLESANGLNGQPCIEGLFAMYVERAAYTRADGRPVDVVAARFNDHATATRVVRGLNQFTRYHGAIGAFTHEVTPIDYFYGRIQAYDSFVWSHEDWVFIVTSDSFVELEALAEIMPY